jgi:hypothetical protein
MNSIPQQEVAKGSGQMEFFRASPTTSLSLVVKNPSPLKPSGMGPIPIAVVMSASFGVTLNLTGRAITFLLSYGLLIRIYTIRKRNYLINKLPNKNNG